jgi:hypothetical protein
MSSSKKKRIKKLNSNKKNTKNKNNSYKKISQNNQNKNTYKKKAKEFQEINKNNKDKEKILEIPKPNLKNSNNQNLKNKNNNKILKIFKENEFLFLGIFFFLISFLLVLLLNINDSINPNVINDYSINSKVVSSENLNQNSFFSNFFSKLYEENKYSISRDKEGWERIFPFKPLSTLFEVVFGKLIIAKDLTETSSVIVTIALWILFFLTFADIISSFSTFQKNLSYAIAFILTILIANFGFIFNCLYFVIQFFGLLFGFSVILGLFGSFLTFLVINLGIHKLSNWALKRKTMLHLAQSKTGAESIKQSLEAIDKVGNTLRNIGEKEEQRSK